MIINTFDLDGVIFFENGLNGVMPNPNDVIVTGRSIEEAKDTLLYLKDRDIHNQVFFNPIKFDEKSRESSGEHKARTIQMLINSGFKHGIHFEDDPVQIEVISKALPNIRIVKVLSNLVELENVRHEY